MANRKSQMANGKCENPVVLPSAISHFTSGRPFFNGLLGFGLLACL
jgi:hypothetical protein